MDVIIIKWVEKVIYERLKYEMNNKNLFMRTKSYLVGLAFIVKSLR